MAATSFPPSTMVAASFPPSSSTERHRRRPHSSAETPLCRHTPHALHRLSRRTKRRPPHCQPASSPTATTSSGRPHPHCPPAPPPKHCRHPASSTDPFLPLLSYRAPPSLHPNHILRSKQPIETSSPFLKLSAEPSSSSIGRRSPHHSPSPKPPPHTPSLLPVAITTHCFTGHTEPLPRRPPTASRLLHRTSIGRHASSPSFSSAAWLPHFASIPTMLSQPSRSGSPTF